MSLETLGLIGDDHASSIAHLFCFRLRNSALEKDVWQKGLDNSSRSRAGFFTFSCLFFCCKCLDSSRTKRWRFLPAEWARPICGDISIVHTLLSTLSECVSYSFKNLTLEYQYMYGQVRFSTLFAGTDILRTKGTFWYFYPVMGPMPLQYDINFPFSEPLQFFGYLLVFFIIFNYVGALLGLSVAYAIQKRRKPSERTPNRRMILKVGEDSDGAAINPRKMVALIPFVFIGLYFYLGVVIWNALLSSFSPYAGGGLETVLLFVFISWIGFGFLVCYFLGLLMITILRNKKSEK